MKRVVASIGSDGLLGMAVVFTPSAGFADGTIVGGGSSTLQLHQQRLTGSSRSCLSDDVSGDAPE